MNDMAVVARMRALIGKRFLMSNRRWVLIDVLTDERVVVLQGEHGAFPIQVNQFGQPHRKAIETRSIPIFADDDNLSDELMLLLESPDPGPS